jgi:hypothetical protein
MRARLDRPEVLLVGVRRGDYVRERRWRVVVAAARHRCVRGMCRSSCRSGFLECNVCRAVHVSAMGRLGARECAVVLVCPR